MIPKEDTRAQVPKIARYLSDAETRELLMCMERRRLSPNESLLTLGEANDSVYYVERGELVVSLPLPHRTLHLGSRPAGSWVGEITFLEAGPATASVAAGRDSVVMGLARDRFLDLGARHPDIAARFLRAVSEDLVRRIRNAGVVLEAPVITENRPSLWSQMVVKLFSARSPS